MTKKIVIICDCGCGKTTTRDTEPGWLRLDQSQFGLDGLEVKLEGGVLHFFSFDCIGVWWEKASKVAPKLAASARGLHPRGKIQSDSFPSIYV